MPNFTAASVLPIKFKTYVKIDDSIKINVIETITGLEHPEMNVSTFSLKVVFGANVKNETMTATSAAKMGDNCPLNQIVETKKRPTKTKNGNR